MKSSELFHYVFVDAITQLDVNELYIVSGYSTPNMASWVMTEIQQYLRKPVSIHLLIGMTPEDGLTVSAHKGFKDLMGSQLPLLVQMFECSYIFQKPSVHSKLYVWCKDQTPVRAYVGSANFTQSAFSNKRREVMAECSAEAAYSYYNSLIGDSIYCNHSEVEEHITLYATHPVLDMENRLIASPSGKAQNALQGVERVSLSLLTRTGETGERSGINWGHRGKRNRSEAYIGLPAKIARSGFFPLAKRHFTVITDDGHQLILRVEQEGDKAITTPLSNARLGEYLRFRIGLPSDAFVKRADLEDYGRTDVTFYKLDEEQFYMDFSV